MSNGLRQQLLSLAAFGVATGSLLAVGQSPTPASEDLVLGTWVLNVEKSNYIPGPPPKSQTRTYEAHPDGVKTTITTINADGQSVTVEYVAKYDSLEYPLTGSKEFDAIALKRINARTAEATLTHARKTIGTARRVISEDGKTMTITFKGSDPQGNQVTSVAVYDRQGGT